MLLALCGLVVPAAACSDDGTDERSTDGSSVAMDPQEQKQLIPRTDKCEAEVSTTGAYEAEWSGQAQVRTGGKAPDDAGPQAVYQLTDKQNRVALFSPGPDFKGSISLTVKDVAYSSDPGDAESFHIDERGAGASVDATLTSVSGAELHLVAEFTCGGGKGKK
jgi:hypothetical protein